MSKANSSTHQTLASHSTAKVEVFTNYLGLYLNILGMAGMQQVHIYDLMCGEGQYADGNYGSALKGLRRLLAYFSEYPAHTLRVAYSLNDEGKSKVEKGRLKIDRVRERAEKLPFANVVAPARLTLNFTADPYETAVARAIAQTRQLAPKDKALLFIDPWGYKDIRIGDLRDALAGGNSEVLLFLPAEMMFRFAGSAYTEPPPGSEALQHWLTELFPGALPRFSSVHDFINQFREALRQKLEVPYSSRFTLETDDHNTYSLFYFTSSRTGLVKMLEAQWRQDQATGSGHRVERSFTLFAPGEGTAYPAQLERFLAAGPRTNEDVLEFGLRSDFLPKHSNDVLRKLAAQERVVVTPLDGQPIRKGFFYLDSKPPRRVMISLQSPS